MTDDSLLFPELAMTYSRLDGSMWRNPKMWPVSDSAFRLYICAISYAGDTLSDGLVPHHVISALAKNADASIAELERLGLITNDASGWRIHDYLQWNPSRADVMHLSEARKAAGMKGGRPSGSQPRKPNAKPIALANAKPIAKAVAGGDLDLDLDLRTKKDGGTNVPPSESSSATPPTDGSKSRKMPLPFRAETALLAVRDAAPTAVQGFDGRDIGRRAIAVERIIPSYPTIDEWTRAGRFLEAGGMPRIERPIGIGYLVSEAFRDCMGAARAWVADGARQMNGAHGNTKNDRERGTHGHSAAGSAIKTIVESTNGEVRS